MEEFWAMLYLLLILFFACASEKKDRPTFDYLFEQPLHIYNLPAELTEVPGLQTLENNKIACIQDEEDIVFVYGLENSRIVRTIRFDKNGDYEGIALVDNALSVTESNRKLHFIRDFNTKESNATAETIETQFSEENNIGIHPYYPGYLYNRIEKPCPGDPGRKWQIKHVYDIQSSLFIQPEGITLADNGDLYISNEGRAARPVF